jgi:hypothetical protein
MERRDFIGAAAVAGAGLMAADCAKAAGEELQFIEMREYSILSRDYKQAINGYLGEALVPALNRIGLKPVGVLSPSYGSDSNTYHVIIPHNSCETALNLHQQLLDDAQFSKDAAGVLGAPSGEAGYVRIKSSLLRSFAGCPKIEAPDTSKGRIFELRRYESHNIQAGKTKVRMFNEGEIAVFRKTGLTPVLFAETLIGDRMPNLTYMLTFADMAERDANWKQFVSHPDWKAMAADKQYKDTVSNISDTILKPAGYSQI